MLRSEAARYARWSASIAVVLAGATLFVYLQLGWTRHLEKKKAPPPPPVEVSRQSHGINFKKVDQNQTIFEVTASRSTEFKGKDDNLLEEVEITIFGKTGERHDVIHTQSCQYGKDNGGIVCSGDVQIMLLSAADAKRTGANPAAAKALATRVETRGVTFDRASGVARTDQRVTFEFPSGHGEAQGLEYHSEEGALQLRQNVRFHLVGSSPGAHETSKRSTNNMSPADEIQVQGTHLDFGRDTRIMHLTGPAEAVSGTKRLTAGEITLLLGRDFRAEKLTATGGTGMRPTVSTQGPQDRIQLEADTLTAHFSPEGSITQVDAQGAVHGVRVSAAEEDEAKADSATLELWPVLSQLKQLNLNGSVALTSKNNTTAGSRALHTSAFRMEFSGGERGTPNKLQKAETLAAGAMEWTDVVQPAGANAKTKLQADRLEMAFNAVGKPQQLVATGNVQTERSVTGRATQTATARNGAAELQPGGGWLQMELEGDVRLKEGEHAGEGEHALFVRASQTAVLTGKAVARDAATETHAPKITFLESTGDIHADGGVRSTDLSASSSAVQLAPAPAHITAETLQANSKAGRALYSGHARLWQGESVLEADSIELLRQSRTLNAVGNVRGVFPQQPASSSGYAAAQAAGGAASASFPSPSATPDSRKRPQLWHIKSGMLAYYDLEGRARLEKDVVVQSPDQRTRCPLLHLYFTRNPKTTPNATNSSSNPPQAAQQISRAVGSGGVTVEEGQRRAVAEQGEYLADAGKFVMSGGNPTIYDGSAGTTSGHQLTFFLADDTIIVDSETGSRTLTKHRVEK